METKKLIEAVQKYALLNYDRGGWDYVVECYGAEEIGEIIESQGATTVVEAIKYVSLVCAITEEQRFEAQALSGELDHYGIVEVDGKLVRKLGDTS